jgi:hypothetical protein
MQSMFFCGCLLSVSGTAMCIVISVLVSADLGGFVWPSVDMSLYRNHAVATGAITGLEVLEDINFPSGHPRRVAFSFRDDQGRTMDGVGYMRLSVLGDRSVGDALRIEYDPADPTRARPAGGSAAMMLFGLHATVWAVTSPMAIVGLVLLLVVWRRSRRERLLLEHGAAADAEVTDSKLIWYVHFNRKHPSDVYYRFRDRQGTEVTGRDRTYRYAWAEALTPGEKVTVIYNPVASGENALWLHGS